MFQKRRECGRAVEPAHLVLRGILSCQWCGVLIHVLIRRRPQKLCAEGGL